MESAYFRNAESPSVVAALVVLLFLNLIVSTSSF